MSGEQFWLLVALGSTIVLLLGVCAWQLWLIRVAIERHARTQHVVSGQEPAASEHNPAAGHVGTQHTASVRDAGAVGGQSRASALLWPSADRVATPAPRDDRPPHVDGFDPTTRDWHRRSVLMWVGLFPALTLMLMLLGPAIEDWPVALRTLLVTSVVAPLMVLLILPTLAWVFEDWLVPPLPPRVVPWRLAIVTWLAMYPTMTGVLWLFEELIAWLPLGVRAFLVTVIAVPIVRYLLLPRLRRATRVWLVH